MLTNRGSTQPTSATSSPPPLAYSASPHRLSEPMLSDSASPFTPRSPYPDLPRCSLRLAFLVCTVLQVSIACVLVWYLGYQSQLSTVSSLSSQLRNQTLSHVLDQMSAQLANPILAVNEIELITQQRLLLCQTNSDPVSAIDWSTDSAFYTTLANIIHHYPGVTATALQTTAAVLMTAFLGFNNSNPDGSPPFLAFLNQDAQSGWGWAFWISSYHQTLYRLQLYNDINILATTANWFDELPTGDLARGRADPILDIGYVDPNANNWYSTCLALGQQSILSNDSTSVNVGWSIPLGTVNHSTASTTETLSICKPHINRAPNPTWMMDVAVAANATKDPRAPFLFQQAQLQLDLVAQGLPPQPIVEWVSDVTFDPYALVVFMTSRLNGFIVQNGAAFICTTTGWILASTLPGPDLDVLAYMPDLCFPPNATLADYAASITLQHPRQMSIVCSLYANMRSAAWQVNLDSVSLLQASSNSQFSWEQSESVHGEAMYVQYTSLGVPASNFSFVLVVYSRQSDYDGDIGYNSMLSGVLSAVVVIVSIIVTLILTSCINQPILTLIVAMRAVLGDTPWRQQGKASPGDERRRSLKQPAPGPDPLPPHPTATYGKDTSAFNRANTSPSDGAGASSPGKYPVALSSPSTLSTAPKELTAGNGPLLPAALLRTSSSSSDYGRLASPVHSAFLSPAASTRTMLPSSATTSTPSQVTTTLARLQWQPSVYSKFVPAGGAGEQSNAAHLEAANAAQPPLQANQLLRDAPELHKVASDSQTAVAKWLPPPTVARTEHEAALHIHTSPSAQSSSPSNQSSSPMPTVHFSGAAAEVSRAGRSSRSEHDDTSSYELDLLLQKWQRTMRMQGIRLPPEWEDDLQEDSARLRELRMGLREARKRYKGRQMQKRGAAGAPNPALSSDDDDNDDDRSIFTPGDGLLTRALARVRSAVFASTPRSRGGSSSRNAAEHSHSASHASQSSNSSDAHSVSCRCSACQRHRFTIRVFGCGGQFSEVVQLQMTFGAMLFRLRNSALRLEQANTKTRSLVRFVFHEVRVPLNALGLGVEQMHDIIVARQHHHRQHARHIQQQTALLHRAEDLVHASSYAQLPSLLSQLDDLRFHCPHCSDPEQNAESMDGNSLALLHIVQDQVASVTRILNDVLSFQRIEEGEMKLEITPFRVQGMVNNTLHSFQAEFKQKQLKVRTDWVDRVSRQQSTLDTDAAGQSVGVKEVRLEVNVGGEGVEMAPLRRAPELMTHRSASLDGRWEGDPGWWVLGDQYRLRQVLANFLSNACKFSREGGDLVVTASLSSQSAVDPATQPSFDAPSSGADHSCYLQLSVRDTGIGISQAGLSSLFQPYSQIRPGALQEGKGSGLGLSICKKIVELHGGGVLVSSKPGEGSTFSFEVPVERLGEEKAAALAASGQSDKGEEEREDSAAAEREEDESKHAGQMGDEGDGPALYPVVLQHQMLVVNSPELPIRRVAPQVIPPDTVAEAEATDARAPPPPYAPRESNSAAAEAAALSTSASPPLVMDDLTLSDAVVPGREKRRDSTPETALAEGGAAPTKAAVSATERLPNRRLTPLRPAGASISTDNTPEKKRGLAAVGASGKAGSAPALRALVVEDSAVNRKLLVMMCTSLGLKVDSAEDGQFAYDLVAGHIAEQKRQQLALLSPDGAVAPASPSASPVSLHSPAQSLRFSVFPLSLRRRRRLPSRAVDRASTT